jgi:serine/threonine-protein kinase
MQRQAATPAGAAIDPARWALISARLDELLDLDPAARQARLAEWPPHDPVTAAELLEWLVTVQAVRDESFLEGSAAAPAAPRGIGPGSVCGAWTLERVLGSGGMGSVWLARRTDGRYAAQAAIKLPHPAVLARGGAGHFEREGRLLARVSHPHIAGLLDAGVAPSGQPYLVLEYVEGEPIDRWCDAQRLAVPERVALFQDVLAAVAHAHGQLVLHRDLKPSNILVDGEGRVKLLDFGIAKLIEPDAATAADAAATTRAFTPDHVAPEQLQGQPAGTASDVYALGVLLYGLLAGRHPTALPSHSPLQRLRAVVEAVPPAMSEAARRAGAEAAAHRACTPRQLARVLQGDLDTIVAKALKKSPAERYTGAAALADDLQRWQHGQPVLAQPDRAAYRMRLFVKRNRLAVTAAAAGVALLVAGAAATGWQAVEARRERDEARWQADRAQARSTLYSVMLGQMGGLDAPLTQRQILGNAERLVEARYASQPRLAVELLLPIAGQYHTLGDIEADLRVMQLAARMARASGDADLAAVTACSTVDTYLKLDRLDDAEAVLASGQAAQASLAAPQPMTQATCWRYEAELAHERGQRQRALAAGLRARQRLEASGLTDRNLYSSLLAQLVYVHRDNGDLPSAFAAAERAAGHHRARSGGGSLESSIVEFVRAGLLAEAGEVAAARKLVRDVVDRFGTAGPPARLLHALARLELDGGLVGDAQATAARIDGAAQRSGAPADAQALAAELRLHLALVTGQAADARRWHEAARPFAGRRALRSVVPTLQAAQAQVLLAEGRAAEAARAIDAELARLEAAGIARPEQRARAWRIAAQIGLAAGDPARAAAHARAALEVSTRAARDPGASAHVGQARLLLARARLAQGDAAAAREEAVRAAGSLARGLGADHPLSIQARELAAPP